jgi:CHAT domain-containing protein
LRPEEKSSQRLEELQEQAQSHEKELLRTLRELPAHERENATLEAPADFSLCSLQASLPKDATLVEYFASGERILAAVVSKDSLEILALTLQSRVAHFLQLLRFQLSKFRMGSTYVQRFEEPLLRATQSHLQALYTELVAPLRSLLRGKHIIFVPHGSLHFLPFHALRDGDDYLTSPPTAFTGRTTRCFRASVWATATSISTIFINSG